MPKNPSLERRRLEARAAAMAVAVAAISCNMVLAHSNGLKADLLAWGFEEHTVRLGADTVHYWDGGHGPPILLVHGIGGDGMWVWHEQAEYLVSEHRVIIPDLLWFGGSESASKEYTVQHQMRMLVALLEALDLEQVDVVGLSYGGIVACGMASTYPSVVGKLAIIGAPCCGFGAADLQTVKNNLGDDVASVFMPTDRESLTKVMSIGYKDPPYAPGFAKDQIIATLYAPYRDQKTQLLHTLMRDLERLSQQSCSRERQSLIIWGEGDPLFPLAMGRRFADSLGDSARFHVIPGARHAPNLDHQHLVNPLLTDFLARPGPTAARVSDR